MSGISKIFLVVATVVLMTAFSYIAVGNYAGAVFGFVLVGAMLYEVWWYKDL